MWAFLAIEFGMGEIGFYLISASHSSSLVAFCGAVIAIVLVLISNEAAVCNGGKTSTFVRKAEKTVDMPLDSDVFRVPCGYNAPQQVPTAYF